MQENLFYGIVFPSEIPQAYVNIFEGVLEECCTLRKISVPTGFHPPQPPSESESASDSDSLALTTISTSNEPESMPIAARALSAMSSGISTGANAIVEGITNGSYILAATARTGGEFIMRNITPSAEPAKVPAPVVGTVAGKLSPVCVAVSKVLISSLSALADEVGKTVAKGISSVKPNSGPSSPPGPTATAAKKVGKSSLQAFLNIWEALEQAGALLLEETSSVTVGIVDHKYGAHAAQVTKDGMKVTGDLITSAYNFNQLGVKSIAKKTISQAGKHTVTSFIDDEQKAIEGGEETLALPAPEEKLALPAPEEKLALPAPEEKPALTPEKTPSE